MTGKANEPAPSGAEKMRNRCAFTSRDMGADWPEAFTYAVVLGWGPDSPDDEDATTEIADRFGWDAELVAFLQETHRQFAALSRTLP
jgi:hypothetical protein